MSNRYAEELLRELGLDHVEPSLGVQLTLGHGQLNAEAELELPPSVTPQMRPNWWDTPYGRWRLDVELQAMHERFPNFEAGLLGDLEPTWREALAWRGQLQSGLPGGARYLVLVAYHPSFPDAAPEVAITDPELPEETPHVIGSRQPCLYYRGRYDNGYDPARTTAATLVGWTALWIHAFEIWVETGKWPGSEI